MAGNATENMKTIMKNVLEKKLIITYDNMALDLFHQEKGERGYMDMKVVNSLLEEINADRTVPKNIRNTIQQVKGDLNNEKLDMAVKINSAVSLLDEVSNDPNIPIYTRTQIWNIVSMLEVMNEKEKVKNS